MTSRAAALLVLTAGVLAGCRSEEAAAGEGAAARPGANAATGTAAAKPAAAATTATTTAAATTAASEWSCGAVHDGARLQRKGLGNGRGRVMLGVVADTKEALPETLANLGRFAAAFKHERVDAVLALGGLGANEDEIARVLAALRPAGAPILALAGDREPEAAFHAAVRRLGKAGLDVVDLVDKRLVEGDGFDVISLPGYPFRPPAAPAGFAPCRYRPADLPGLRSLAAARTSDRPLILAAHTPPRGHGPLGLDWALGGANVGDPLIAPLVALLKPKVALFAHVAEAGGHALQPHDCAGCAAPELLPLGPGVWVDRLWLNAGAADAVPHDLVGGGSARGRAVLVELADGRVRFRVLQ